MTLDQYKHALQRMGVSSNTTTVLCNAYAAGMHEAISILENRKKVLNERYKRDSNINTYTRHREVVDLLNVVVSASKTDSGWVKSWSEVSPSSHKPSPSSHWGFTDGGGI